MPAVFGGLFHSCIELRSPQESQKEPAWISRQADRFWHQITLELAREAQDRRLVADQLIRQTLMQIPQGPEFPETNEEDMDTEAHYARLPEVRVDQGHGAIFPIPILPPERFSWYQTGLMARHILKLLNHLDRAVEVWRLLPLPQRASKFDSVSLQLSRIHTESAKLAQYVRYLESWVPQLQRQWLAERARGGVPAGFHFAQAIQKGDPVELDQLREELRPQRVLRRSFLPDNLEDAPGGVVVITMITDVVQKKFLAEVEGAMDTHWNQSPWARDQGVSFHIRWKFIKKDPRFLAGKVTLADHLSSFPKDEPSMTTGGLTTFVKGSTLVLGPGKLNPRTLAHELGHIIGFGDCYLRTLSGQGFFGLAVLEWDNPFFPDDLMCDNTVGVPRAEVW